MVIYGRFAKRPGNDFDVVKLEVKYRAVVFMGYPILMKADGTQAVDIWGRPKGIGESDSSVEECALLIEAVHILASELGIILKEE